VPLPLNVDRRGEVLPEHIVQIILHTRLLEMRLEWRTNSLHERYNCKPDIWKRINRSWFFMFSERGSLIFLDAMIDVFEYTNDARLQIACWRWMQLG
jgi:hypothetical protein